MEVGRKSMKRLMWSVPLLVAGLAAGQEFKLGSKIADFTVSDLSGGAAQYSALKGKTTIVMFISAQCPVSNGYNQRMVNLYNDYSTRGVKFIFINANSTETAAEVGEHARSHGFPFPVYKDVGNVVADRFGASVTPEAFVMDSNGTIRYHGYMDDSLNPAHIQNQALRRALDEVLMGKPVTTAETKAFGCSIKRQKQTS